jgi:tetratricopeptide (TPR) repeat protein
MGPRLGGVFAVALGVRLLHIASLASAPVFGLRMGDGRIFHAWAQRLAGGDWVGSEVFFQAPLYPYFLGVVYAALGEDPRWLLGLQAVIGAASCAVVAAAGQRLFSPRAGLAAGLLLAVYPPVVFSDGLVQKSVLVLFLMSLLLFVWAGVLARSGRTPRIREFGLLGLVLAGLVLSRENAGVLALPILLWLLLEGALSARRRLALLAALACGLALLLAPVAIRNRVVAGELVLTTSNLGPNLYMGNNERADGFYLALAEGRGSPSYEREDAVRLAQEALSRELSAREVSTYWTGRALDYIGSHPIQWTGLVLRKWLLLWNRREFADTEDLASHADWSPVLWGLAPFHFGVLAPLAALGAAVTWRQRRKLWSLYGMLAVYASSVVLFFVFARFRLPLIPFLVLFAGAGLVRLPELVRSRSRRQLTALAAGVIGVAVFCNWPVQTRAGAAWLSPYNVGTALLAERRYEEAARSLAEAVRLAPSQAVAHYNLAQALQFQGRLGEAVPHFQAATRLADDLPHVREGVCENAKVLASLADEASGDRARAHALSSAARALAPACGAPQSR